MEKKKIFLKTLLLSAILFSMLMISNYAYAATEQKSYVSLKREDIRLCEVKLEQDIFTYDGLAKEPKVTLKKGDTLIPKSKYTVEYIKNILPGTALAKIQGKENYEGIIYVPFVIQKATDREIITCLYASNNAQEVSEVNDDIEIPSILGGDSQDVILVLTRDLKGTLSIPKGNSLILNTYKHTFTGQIKNEGTIKIIGEGKITGSDVTIINSGTVWLYNATVSSTRNGYMILNKAGATFNMNNPGKVVSKNGGGIYNYGRVNISGGTISAKKGNYCVFNHNNSHWSISKTSCKASSGILMNSNKYYN